MYALSFRVRRALLQYCSVLGEYNHPILKKFPIRKQKDTYLLNTSVIDTIDKSKVYSSIKIAGKPKKKEGKKTKHTHTHSRQGKKTTTKLS